MRKNRTTRFADQLEGEFIHPLSFQNSNQSTIIADIGEHYLAGVKLTGLLRGRKTLCPIYLRLSQDSYLQFLEKGEPINSQDIVELLQRGVQHFYVEKSRIVKSKWPLMSICSLVPESS